MVVFYTRLKTAPISLNHMKKHKLKDSSNEERRLRQIEQENKALRKKVSRLHKKSRIEEVEPDEDEYEIETDKFKSHTRCPLCSKGKLEIIDLGARTLTVCNLCDYKQVGKKK
jgi:hypothetical protein